MCQTLDISQSGFYRWTKALLSPRKKENARIKERIKEIFIAHGGMVGSPIVTADLHDDQEFSKVSRPRVSRMMRKMELRCRARKKFVVTTDSRPNYPVAPNLLNRNFSVSAPDVAWVSDITYLKIGRRWHYLTVFIDLFSRIVVGWDLSDSLERYSAIRALNKAIMRRRPAKDLLVHSDRGVQYARIGFRKVLQKHGFLQSMSCKGNCWDTQWPNHFSIRSKRSLFIMYGFKGGL